MRPRTAALADASPWLTLTEAAAHARMHRDTLAEFLVAQRVPHRRVGRTYRIKRDVLDQALDADAERMT